MLSVIMLDVTYKSNLSVIILNVTYKSFMLSVIILSVVSLNGIMLSVAAPKI